MRHFDNDIYKCDKPPDIPAQVSDQYTSVLFNHLNVYKIKVQEKFSDSGNLLRDYKSDGIKDCVLTTVTL